MTNMNSMFSAAGSFNKDIGSWNVSSVIDMERMFFRAGLSTPNYDELLIGWAAQNVQNNVEFYGGNSQYSTAAESARNTLIESRGWSITDEDLAP